MSGLTARRKDTITTSTHTPPAPDEDLKFIKEIIKLNKGFRVSRKQTKMSQVACLIDFLKKSEIPNVGNKFLFKKVTDCEEWARLLDDSEPAEILTNSHDKKSDDEEIGSAMVVPHEDKFFDEDEKPIKLWVMAGLHSKPKHSHSKKEKFKFPLPLGAGLRRLNSQEDFQLPWNIYCPSNGERKVLRWKSLKKNVWHDPKQHMKIVKALKAKDNGTCDCNGDSCGESCFNRMFQLECDSSNCSIGPGKDCGNRNFTNLSKKLVANSRFANGVEVVSAGNKGNGLRSIRLYEPHSLIIEYTGEVIDQEEVERRLNEEFGGYKHHYYFLSLGQGLSIDGGTKGSVARFANHSCEPNAEMQKWIVNGEPRIGLFAGPRGINPSEEITYHYNFEWFPDADPQPCYCGAAKCSGFIGKRNSSSSNNQSVSPTPSRQGSPIKMKLLTYSKQNINNNNNTNNNNQHESNMNNKNSKELNFMLNEKNTNINKYGKNTTEDNPYDRKLLTNSSRLRRHADDDISYLDIVASLPPHVQRQLSINMAPPGKEIDEDAIGLAQLAANAALIHGDKDLSRPRTRHAECESAIDAGIPLKYLKKINFSRESPSSSSSSSSLMPPTSSMNVSSSTLLVTQQQLHKRTSSSNKVKLESASKRKLSKSPKKTPKSSLKSNSKVVKATSTTGSNKVSSSLFIELLGSKNGSKLKNSSSSKVLIKKSPKSPRVNNVFSKNILGSLNKLDIVKSVDDEIDEDSLPQERDKISESYNCPNKTLPTRQLNDYEIKLGSSKYIKLLKNLLIDDEVPLIMERTPRRVVVSRASSPIPDSILKKKQKKANNKKENNLSSKALNSVEQLSSRNPLVQINHDEWDMQLETTTPSPPDTMTKKLPRHLSQLMIDDKIPTVFERSPRTLSRLSVDKHRNLENNNNDMTINGYHLPSYLLPPAPPPASVAMSKKMYESLPSTKRRKMRQQLFLMNSAMPPSIDSFDILNMPRIKKFGKATTTATTTTTTTTTTTSSSSSRQYTPMSPEMIKLSESHYSLKKYRETPEGDRDGDDYYDDGADPELPDWLPLITAPANGKGKYSKDTSIMTKRMDSNKSKKNKKNKKSNPGMMHVSTVKKNDHSVVANDEIDSSYSTPSTTTNLNYTSSYLAIVTHDDDSNDALDIDENTTKTMKEKISTTPSLMMELSMYEIDMPLDPRKRRKKNRVGNDDLLGKLSSAFSPEMILNTSPEENSYMMALHNDGAVDKNSNLTTNPDGDDISENGNRVFRSSSEIVSTLVVDPSDILKTSSKLVDDKDNNKDDNNNDFNNNDVADDVLLVLLLLLLLLPKTPKKRKRRFTSVPFTSL